MPQTVIIAFFHLFPAIQPEESDAIAKKSKNGQMRFQSIVAKTKMAVVVWRTRWKANKATFPSCLSEDGGWESLSKASLYKVGKADPIE